MRIQGDKLTGDLLGKDVAKSIKSAFEMQAKQGPEKVALVFHGRPVSYGELHAFARKLAERIEPQ